MADFLGFFLGDLVIAGGVGDDAEKGSELVDDSIGGGDELVVVGRLSEVKGSHDQDGGLWREVMVTRLLNIIS